MATDSVVLAAGEVAELSDRVYQVQRAAEDVATAVGGQGRRGLALSSFVRLRACRGG